MRYFVASICQKGLDKELVLNTLLPKRMFLNNYRGGAAYKYCGKAYTTSSFDDFSNFITFGNKHPQIF